MLPEGPCHDLAPLHGLSIARTDAVSWFLKSLTKQISESAATKLVKSDISNGRRMRELCILTGIETCFDEFTFSG